MKLKNSDTLLKFSFIIFCDITKKSNIKFIFFKLSLFKYDIQSLFLQNTQVFIILLLASFKRPKSLFKSR